MRQDISFSAIVAGFVAVVVSYAGPALVIFQAASAGHLGADQLASWIWAVSVGSGISAFILSAWMRAPIITAWSTPGAALLVGSLPNFSYAQAVGAFVFSSALITVLGLTGLFEALTSRLPRSLAAAMLAGILFHFGTQVFQSFTTAPVMVGTMLLAYLVFKRVLPRYAVALVLVLGIGLAALAGNVQVAALQFVLTTPQFTMPEFSLPAIVGLGLPLALVTVAGQFVPGVAVLRASGYSTPASPLVWVTSLAGLVLAPFGAHGINLAAITAAICSGPEAHPDPSRRYVAGLALGAFYVLIGLSGAALVSVFAALPKELVATVAGLALLGAIINGLTGAMSEPSEREPALLTFLVTASGLSIAGISSAFWGLLVGVLASVILNSAHARMALQPGDAGS